MYFNIVTNLSFMLKHVALQEILSKSRSTSLMRNVFISNLITTKTLKMDYIV